MGSYYRHLLKFFTFEQLPDHLKEVSKPFSDLAHDIVRGVGEEPGGPDPQVELGLQKLLEAKDCIVRSRLP